VCAMESHGRTIGRVAASERGRRQAPERRETAAGMVILEEARSGSDVIHAPLDRSQRHALDKT